MSEKFIEFMEFVEFVEFIKTGDKWSSLSLWSLLSLLGFNQDAIEIVRDTVEIWKWLNGLTVDG